MYMLLKKALFFVIQKHKATSLHYDFRLQIGGVMPSWAIPKGPTLESGVKRLAMQTPDHELSYRHFEGVIAEGVYGAGPVIIWDEGEYLPEIEVSKGVREQVKNYALGNRVMEEGLKKGEIKFFLMGKRLRGSFALIKTKGFGPKNAWLLIKHNDSYCKEGFNISKENTSVVSEATIEEIANKE